MSDQGLTFPAANAAHVVKDSATVPPLSAFGTLWHLLAGSKIAMVGAAIIAFWTIAALLAPWIAPYPPNKLDPAGLIYPYPSAAHLLGVDHLGRDLLSRILWGARTVLTVAPLAVIGAASLGTLLGLVSGYRGGVIDAVIMRVGDVLLAFPKIILYLIIIARFGASALNIILVVTITAAPIIARMNADYLRASLQAGRRDSGLSDGGTG